MMLPRPPSSRPAPSSSAAAARRAPAARRALLCPPAPPSSRRPHHHCTAPATLIDYGDDDEFYHYLARVELAGPQRGALRVELSGGGGRGGAANPAASVILTATAAAAASATAYLEHAPAGPAATLVLEDDGAWPMERSRRRAFALSSGGGGGAGGDEEASFSLVFSAAAAAAPGSASAPALRLRAAARGLEVAISSAPGWLPGDSGDYGWDAAARMARAAAAEAEAAAAGSEGDGAARATRALVLRPPRPSDAWRCFASGVPVVVDVRLPDSRARGRALRGTMTLERRRAWTAASPGPASHPVAAEARRRRAVMRALSAPPWLQSPWGWPM
jgi:hypothetical protein